MTGTPQSPFGFAGGRGYQEDGDSGLKLLGHRYYDPSSGRFLTRDPIHSGRNWYVYCANNPLSATDNSGLIAQALAIAADALDPEPISKIGIGIVIGVTLLVVAVDSQNNGSGQTDQGQSPDPAPEPGLRTRETDLTTNRNRRT